MMRLRPSSRSQSSLILDSLPTISSRGALLRFQRFDGVQKSRRSWDSSRRDEELWLKDGNCIVHLYAPGTLPRGLSLKLPIETIEQSDCPYLFGESMSRSEVPKPLITSEGDDSDTGYGALISGKVPSRCELYIPAPLELSRHEASLYHIGTRNFFAYLLNKPIIGEHLGGALSNLAARIEAWRPDTVGSTGFLDYCQGQGYLDFSENIEYAVAGLILADQARIAGIWIDAFVHCVGMRQRLDQASEASKLSNTTKALINRASQEMNSHIRRTTTAIGMFLEKELGPEYLGISKPLRSHLDRFRSALQSFYTDKFGYFPPSKSQPWDKSVWIGMYDDFQCLYEYLADTESSTDRASNRGLNGGICVIQNLDAFNERHGYLSLPHPLPLEPESPLHRRPSHAQKGLRGFKLGRSDTFTQPKMTQTLSHASNDRNPEVLNNRLVQQYVRFERSRLEEKVSVIEARKVRWLLIYAVLQTLISITRAPAEVQDTTTPSYPLCVVETGRPSWMLANMDHQDENEPQPRLSAEMDAVRRTMEEDRLSIHPDCEADCAEDFFSMNSFSPRSLDMNADAEPVPGRSPPQLSRTASFRSSVNSLHNSIVGSFSRHSSYSARRRSSLQLSRLASFWEGTPELHDSALPKMNRSDMEQETLDMNYRVSSRDPPTESKMPLEYAFVPTLEAHQLTAPAKSLGWCETTLGTSLSGLQSKPNKHFVVPTLELDQLTVLKQPDAHAIDPAESPSTQSGTSSQDTCSRPSSYFEEPESPSSEYSSPADGFDTVRADKVISDFECSFGHGPLNTISERPPAKQLTVIADTGSPVSIHTGGYVPISLDSAVCSRMQSRAMSAESVCSVLSSASSQYPECSQQAAEIEEEDTRGRQRLRGLRKINAFGVVDEEISLPSSPL